MSIEAMKQALEALESYHGYMEPLTTVFGGPRVPAEQSTTGKVERSITSLRQAIAEAEKQEPVGYVSWSYEAVWNGKPPKAESNLYTHPQPKREPLTPLEVKDVLRATGLLTNSQAWDVAEEVMKLLAAHGVTSDMKQEHVDKTAKQRHEENT